MNQAIAQEILRQLGGNRFIAMTGAKNFVYSDTNFSFKIPKAKNGINRIVIKLVNDEYVVSFRRYRLSKGMPTEKVVSEHEGVYFDELQPLFTKETGLYTKLF